MTAEDPLRITTRAQDRAALVVTQRDQARADLAAATATVEKVRALADEYRAVADAFDALGVMIAELRRLLDAPLPSVDGTGDDDATQ